MIAVLVGDKSWLIADLSRVSILQAVGWDTFIIRAKLYDETPLDWDTKKYIANNHLTKGSLDEWKMVLDVSLNL